MLHNDAEYDVILIWKYLKGISTNINHVIVKRLNTEGQTKAQVESQSLSSQLAKCQDSIRFPSRGCSPQSVPQSAEFGRVVVSQWQDAARTTLPVETIAHVVT